MTRERHWGNADTSESRQLDVGSREEKLLLDAWLEAAGEA